MMLKSPFKLEVMAFAQGEKKVYAVFWKALMS